MSGGVSIFVPAYNEAEILSHTMPKLLRAAEKISPDVQLVIVGIGPTHAWACRASGLAGNPWLKRTFTTGFFIWRTSCTM